MYGDFIRAVRRSRGLSQRQLAEASGVAQANISAIENGRRMPSAATLNRMVVSCGYELVAIAGSRIIACPVPPDLYADAGLPRRLPDDPPGPAPALDPASSAEERGRALAAALEVVDATLRR